MEALTSPDPVGTPASFPEAGIEVVHLLNDKLIEKNSELLEMNAQLEQRVGERTADLKRANYQLQQQIQERERTEAELRQVQRLDAVGRLAGGLKAHDFNNLLAIILGQSERLIATFRRLGDGAWAGVDKSGRRTWHESHRSTTRLCEAGDA